MEIVWFRRRWRARDHRFERDQVLAERDPCLASSSRVAPVWRVDGASSTSMSPYVSGDALPVYRLMQTPLGQLRTLRWFRPDARSDHNVSDCPRRARSPNHESCFAASTRPPGRAFGCGASRGGHARTPVAPPHPAASSASTPLGDPLVENPPACEVELGVTDFSGAVHASRWLGPVALDPQVDAAPSSISLQPGGFTGPPGRVIARHELQQPTAVGAG